MKKLFTILAAIFAVFAVNAQTLLSESFEEATLPSTWTTLDNDGDGYTWQSSQEISADWEVHTGTSCATSASYINNVGALNPDNYLISPDITIPAGSATLLTFWYRGQDSNYPAEHFLVKVGAAGASAVSDFTAQVFEATATGDYTQATVDLSSYAGQTIRIAFVHNDVTDMFWLNIDDVEVVAASDAAIMVDPATVDFGTVLTGTNADATVNVTGMLLDAAIAVTTAAPFAVSADGTSFGTTASLPAAGGSLYIRFSPTTAGAANGTLTLTDGTLTATVNLSGSAISCDGVTVPFSEGFENGLNPCWQVIDADGDSYSWDAESPVTIGFEAHTGSGLISSASYINNVGALTPDNWLITPQVVNIPAGTSMTFWLNAQDAGYPEEHYGVYISTTTPEISEFQLIYEETMDANGGPRDQGAWKQKAVDLNAYAGQNIYIAFRHFSCTDAFWLNLDDVEIAQGIGIAENEAAANNVSIYPNPATSILNVNANGYNEVQIINMLGQVVYNTTMNDNAQINVRNLNDGVYFVRLNGANGTTTQKFIKK